MYYACLRGLPPAFVFRRAASWRKYSDPRCAVVVPPLCPKMAAAGSFTWLIRSSVRASAVRSNSRERLVRFSGSGAAVSRIRSISERIFLSACRLLRSDGILLSCGGFPPFASVRCFSFNATFRHYQELRAGRVLSFAEVRAVRDRARKEIAMAREFGRVAM